MALLERLFRSKPKPAILYPGSDRLDVVGESYYQDTLWKTVGGRRSDEVRCETHAVLMPESKDSEYPEAIRVLIDGKVIGSLSRYDAPLYRPGLGRLMGSTNRLVALNATILGGGELGKLGVTLSTTRQTSTSLRRRLINSRLKVGWFRTSEPGSPRRVQPTLRTTATTSPGTGSFSATRARQ